MVLSVLSTKNDNFESIDSATFFIEQKIWQYDIFLTIAKKQLLYSDKIRN